MFDIRGAFNFVCRRPRYTNLALFDANGHHVINFVPTGLGADLTLARLAVKSDNKLLINHYSNLVQRVDCDGVVEASFILTNNANIVGLAGSPSGGFFISTAGTFPPQFNALVARYDGNGLLIGDLRNLRTRVQSGQLKQRELIQRAIGRLQERHPQAWRWLKWELKETTEGLAFDWDWEREKFKQSAQAEGAYLLRAHWTERDPAKLWQTYTQLTEAEAAFRTLKSEVKVRPIWHWTEKRVEAHVLVAFLGYCLWVCLKKKAQRAAPSLTPWQILDQLGRIALVEVWFELRDGRQMCLPRITQPEPAQAVLLEQLKWTLPQQPPPRVHARQVPTTTTPPSVAGGGA